MSIAVSTAGSIIASLRLEATLDVIKRSKQAPRASSFSPPPTSLNKLQDSSCELSRIHAARSCVNPDDAHRASSLRRIRSVADYFLFFSSSRYFIACSHSSRCAGDTNTKWNLIPPLCIFARANPGFPSVGRCLVSIIGHPPLPIDEKLSALFSMPFPYLCLRSIFVVSHLLGHGSP